MWDALLHSLRKNWPELQALCTGRMPAFVYGARQRSGSPPVFCLHAARLDALERQFRFLAENGYRTLCADELLLRRNAPDARRDPREIALTFDDGLGSVWSVAFPLARRYGIRFTLFALPGLTPEREPGPTIDAESGELREQALARDRSDTPFCSWSELRAMHESGIVDVQSHGLRHARVAVGPRIADFVHPGFDAHVANVHVPLYRNAAGRELRDPVWGHPVYEFDSLLAGRPRYLDPAAIRDALAEHVERNGGAAFFERRDWRVELSRLAARCASAHAGHFEAGSERRSAIAAELSESRRQLEARLPGKRVRHFCFPWFRVSAATAAAALDAGYESIHVGATPGFRAPRGARHPQVITRLQQEFLRSLPGDGGYGLWGVLAQKRAARGSSGG